MAAFDFPTSPTVGQIYTLNGVTYRWDGNAWIGGPAVDNTAVYVLKAGDTMTGLLRIDPAAGNDAGLKLDKPASGRMSYVQGLTNNVSRWIMALGDGAAESAGAGSDFGLWRYDDAGAFVDAPFTIARGSGQAAFINTLNAGWDANGHGTVLLRKSASGKQSAIYGSTNNLNRWAVFLGESTAEGGGNSGSNFGVGRFSDAGAYLDMPLSIYRASGKISNPYSFAAAGAGFPAAGATAETSPHLFAPYLTINNTLGLNAYVKSSPVAWASYNGGAGGYVTVDSSANMVLGTGPSVAAGVSLAIASRLTLYGAGYTYVQPRFLAFDGNVAGQAVVGCYQSSQASAMGWLIASGGNYSCYNLDGVGGVTGSPLLTINRSQGITSFGPDATMGFYDNGASARLLSYSSGNYTYISGDFVMVLGSGERFRVRSDGLITSQNGAALKTLAGQWGAISDVRIKTGIRDYTSGLDEILKLQPRWFQFRPETHFADADKDVVGLIAQEVEDVMPECVTIGEGEAGEIRNADMRTLDPTAIMYALVNAVKTLTARVAELEAAR